MMVTKARRNAEATEFRAEEVMSPTLPEELVEKILSRVPYPSIFKARLLSKSWLAMFKPISSLDTAEEMRLAKVFQKEVTESSINWNTFCVACTSIEDPVVYNHAEQKWQALPPLSLLPNLDMLPPLTRGCGDLILEGAFLCETVLLNKEEPDRQAILLVNILTEKGEAVTSTSRRESHLYGLHKVGYRSIIRNLQGDRCLPSFGRSGRCRSTFCTHLRFQIRVVEE